MPRPRLWPCLLVCLLLAACAAPAATPRPPAGLASAATQPAPSATPARLSTATAAPATLAPSATTSATPTRSPTPAPNRTASPTPCAARGGVVRRIQVPSPTLRYDIDARLYLPPCYAASDERYPVLYLIHGLNFTEDQWLRLGAAETADALIAAGQIAPLIIVMPRDRRDSRLDPAFVDDLVPFIDAQYRTRNERAYRAIGGLSRGAGWAAHLGLRYPGLFGRIGLHSPAVFYGDETSLLQWTRTVAESGPVPAISMDIGDGDGQPQSARWLHQVFTWFDLEHAYLVQPGGHTERYWSAHVADYLRFYAAGWRSTRPPWRDATGTPVVE